MKEVIYPKSKEEQSNTNKKCPYCGGEMRHTTIPCPEGKKGCLVCHYGYKCLKCGKIFQ